MKRMSCLLLLELTVLFLSTSTFAYNQCIKEIDKHVYKGGPKGGPYYYRLDLEKCELQDRDINEIVLFLKKHDDISHLDLSDNYITARGAKTFADSGLEMTLINMRKNLLGDEGAIIFSKINGKKRFYTPLLSLVGNNISDKGAKALAEHSTWTTLYLDKNHIENAGAIALSKNKAVESLWLNNNDIDNEGAIEMAHSIHENRTMHTLEIGWNHIGTSGLQALTALKNDHVLWNLWVEGNDGQYGDIPQAKLAKRHFYIPWHHQGKRFE